VSIILQGPVNSGWWEGGDGFFEGGGVSGEVEDFVAALAVTPGSAQALPQPAVAIQHSARGAWAGIQGVARAAAPPPRH